MSENSTFYLSTDGTPQIISTRETSPRTGTLRITLTEAELKRGWNAQKILEMLRKRGGAR